MECVDVKVYADWKAKNTDSYGGACFEVAEAWVDKLEALFASVDVASYPERVPLILRDFGESTFKVADDASPSGGVTGFQYGMIVSILAKCWVHGEELRKWHNLKTQIGNEGEKANKNGGVLNPAMLHIG
jgi:hypothetical protein